MKNLGQLIRSASEQLCSVGISEYYLESELIWMETLHIDRAGLYLQLNEYPKLQSIETAEKLLSRRLKREPLAYIIGRKEFYGLVFKVKPGVLIPRQDTETLIEEAIQILQNNHCDTPIVFDVGCGSGIIGISLATQFPCLKVIAIDSDPSACYLTKQNAENLGVSNQLEVIQADLLTSIEGRADLIVANLPYIPSSEIKNLQPEVRIFEKRVALDGGLDGFDLTRMLINQSKGSIKIGGAMLMEIDPKQVSLAKKAIGLAFPTAEFKTKTDLSGFERVAICITPTTL